MNFTVSIRIAFSLSKNIFDLIRPTIYIQFEEKRRENVDDKPTFQISRKMKRGKCFLTTREFFEFFG